MDFSLLVFACEAAGSGIATGANQGSTAALAVLSSPDHQTCYFVGIVDILQIYSLRKLAENHTKALLQVACRPRLPPAYRRAFACPSLPLSLSAPSLSPPLSCVNLLPSRPLSTLHPRCVRSLLRRAEPGELP